MKRYYVILFLILISCNKNSIKNKTSIEEPFFLKEDIEIYKKEKLNKKKHNNLDNTKKDNENKNTNNLPRNN